MAKRGWGWCIPSISFLSLICCGCGDSSSGPDDPGDPKDPNDPAATMSARVDGAAWEAAQSVNLMAATVKAIPGGYQIVAFDTPGTSFRQIALNLYNLDSPGTYPFGVTASVVGAYATFQMSGSRTWQTDYTGEAGTLTLSTVNAERLAGTFQFSATPFPTSPATGTVVVTEGMFDVPVSGTVTPVAEGNGSTLSADLGGDFFNASTVVVTGVSPNLFFNAVNDEYNIGFSITGFSGEDEYELDFPTVSVLVIAGNGGATGTNCCWVASQGVGVVEFSRADDDRLVGSFSATLQPQAGSNASEPLVITAGVFDIGLVLP